MNGGLLGGTGSTDSQGLIGTEFGFGTATIAPGATSGSIGDLTFSYNPVGEAADIGPYGVYAADLNSAGLFAYQRSDTITATGVTLPAGARIARNDLAPTTALPVGTVLSLIDNDSIGQITGTFDNLDDGATVKVGANTYVADCEGGSGNDLTLTVSVPEPGALLLIGLLAVPLSHMRRRRT